MPVLTVSKIRMQKLLLNKFNDEEFDKLVFDFGLELDNIYEENGETMYKVDIPANRYDLLSAEGLSQALSTFMETKKFYDIKIENESGLIVIQEGGEERPYIACAVVENVDFSDEAIYNSFIDYQDKLHMTIGRNRTLSSIGTHDFNKITGPVYYKSSKPENIEFVPLNGSEKINCKNLKKYFENDNKISKFFDIINNDENYVYFEDSNSQILSLPPIINSNETKITSQTKNIFIEVTGTSFHCVNTSLKLMLSSFRGQKISSVKIFKNEKLTVTPVMHNNTFNLKLSDIQKSLGIELNADTVKAYLERMMHKVEIILGDDPVFKVFVPDVRSDILHPCDIKEDIAIAHGYNNFERMVPDIATVGEENLLNRFSDKIRLEMALIGYNESLTLTLISKKENIIDTEKAVVLENPKSIESEMVRTSLIPGLLKAIASNLSSKIPFKIFEVADIAVLDANNTFGSSNRRKLAAVYAGAASHLEELQGPLSLLMEKCGIMNYSYDSYPDNNIYLENQAASIKIGDVVIGSMGVCNPKICHLFKIPYAISMLEVDVEMIFQIYSALQI